MLLVNFLTSCAILYVILYRVIGDGEVPAFRKVLLFLVVALVPSSLTILLLGSLLSYAVLPVSYIIQVGLIKIVFKANLKRTALGCGIFYAYQVGFYLLMNSLNW